MSDERVWIVAPKHTYTSSSEVVARLLYIRLVRLGAMYERAEQRRDFGALIEIERQINAIADANENVYVDSAVLRGRNVIRRAHGLEEIHV